MKQAIVLVTETHKCSAPASFGALFIDETENTD